MSAQSTPKTAVAPVGVNHLVLNVRNMERAHQFWTEIMGFHQVGELNAERARWPMRFYSGARNSHHDIALAEVGDAAGEAADWSMAPERPGLNHLAIHYPDRESWLQQLAFLQSRGIKFHLRLNHGMTHSVYIADPDGHGIEVLYELPREVWEGDVNEALNYAEMLPTEGPEALDDAVEYPVFGPAKT